MLKDDQIIFKTDKKLKQKAMEYARKNGTNLSTLIRRSLEKEISGQYNRSVEDVRNEIYDVIRVVMKEKQIQAEKIYSRNKSA